MLTQHQLEGESYMVGRVPPPPPSKGFLNKNPIWQQHKQQLFGSLPADGAAELRVVCVERLVGAPSFMKQLSYFTSCLLSTTILHLPTNLSCHYENSARLQLGTPASGGRKAPLWTPGWAACVGVWVSCNRRREMSDCLQVTAAPVAW